MKLKFKYLAVVGVGTGVIFGGNALAATISLSPFTQILQKQALTYLPKELTGLIDVSGNINLDSTLTSLSEQGAKKAIEQMTSKGAATKTAGQETDALSKDQIEVAQTANSKSHQDSLDDFKTTASTVEQVVTDNSTASESSLAAADKANNINGALVASTQRQIKSINDLTTATQISNTNAIRQAQQDRAEQIAKRIDVAANREDITYSRAVMLNRFYPDSSGNLVKAEGK
jgi:hypothetical protein